MKPDATPLTISAAMIRKYLAYLTVGYFDERDAPPPVLEGYAECARQIQGAAERTGDLAWLRLGLQHILQNPGLDARDFNPDGYSFSDEDLREIMAYLLSTLPAAEASAAAQVTLAELSPPEWLALRAQQAAP